MPVVEGIAIRGIEGFRFRGNPLYFIPVPEFLSNVAIPFAKSIVLPPPMAITISISFFLKST